MGIRSMVAAAVLAVGFVQSADAATIYDYDLVLRYNDTTYVNAQSYDRTTGELLDLGNVSATDNPLGFKGKFTPLSPGEIVSMKVTLLDTGDLFTSDFLTCAIGNWNCYRGHRDIWHPVYGDESSFRLLFDSVALFTFNGEVIYQGANSYGGTWQRMDDVSLFHLYENVSFTIIEWNRSLAPVPLPVSAALLPVGIGALAMMRRRRRIN